MVHTFQGVKELPGKKHVTTLLPETIWATEPMPSGIPPEETVVVTISRQFGSGGSEIGQLVAQEGGLQYIDDAIITEVAKHSGEDVANAEQQDEQTTGMIGHILEAMQASNPFTMHYRTMVDQTARNIAQARELAYLHLTQKVILEAATQGNAVIVGRGSQFLLHNAPRTLHISVFAPLPYRIEQVMKQYHFNHDQARQLIEQRDYERESYLRRYYGSDGQQPDLYHLLLNTGLFSFELAANLIRQVLPVIKEIIPTEM